MKRFFLLIMACFSLMVAHAAYLKDVPKILTQPDGSVLHCYASGDEYFNYLHDENGFTIMQHPETGFYVYADKRDGKLVATEFVAGRIDPASKNLKPFNLISPQEWMARRKAWHEYDRPVVNRDGLPNHGTLNNISIFIRFSDDAEFTNTYSSIDNMFNDETENAISLRTYFRAASYGAIEIPTYFYPGHNGETIISYQDSHPRSYYQPYNASSNPNGYQDSDRASREFGLLQRAVNYINTNYPIPTSLNIDYDNDGKVDNVCFIVRGDVGEWNSLLWPHKWALHDRTVRINGKRVWTFNFQLADATDYFNTSTMCHEMNHSLGAPDLYHYSYSGPDAVGIWDLMHANATPPQHCGAYMKMKYGHWIDQIPEIIQAGTYTLNPISSATPTNIAYKIQSDEPNQYYVLEYRDNTSLFETGLPGSGLLVYRIDTRFEGNENYDPDNGIYDEVYIFRPGGSSTVNGNLYNAYFSSNVDRTEFSASTSAFPFFTDGTIDNNFRIYNITNAGNTISFSYGTSSVCDPPTNLVASVNGKDVSLSWNAAINAQSYNIYRNETLMGNTSNLTYLDSDLPYATFTYYLKSVDANGLISTSSETITVAVTPLQVVAEYYPAADNPYSPYVKVYWNDGNSLFNVYRCSCEGGEEELIAENMTGNQYIDHEWTMLAPGNYKYGVGIVNGKGQVTEIQWNDSQVAPNHHMLDVSASLIPALNQFGGPSRVSYDDGWLYYDDGIYAVPIGIGGSGSTIYWGIMYPSDMLTSYIGNILSKVALYENSYNTEPITLSVYLGSMPSYSTLVYTDTFNPMGGNTFHEITLSEAVAIDGTQNLWIVFSEFGIYPANASSDSGDANGRWFSFDGSNWRDLASLGISGYCWMIRGFIEEGALPLSWSNCIEKPTPYQQTVELQAGWNWFSTYIDGEPLDLLDMLKESLGENALTIEGINGMTENLGDGFWMGELDDYGITNEQMYMIQVENDCTMELSGMPVDPATVGITISPGYNWIGFPCTEEVVVEVAMAGFEAEDGDVIESPDGMTEYLGNGMWFGDFDTFVPSQGYMYFSNSEETKTLVFLTEAPTDTHAYVDLGLPSGLLWATCNVGAENPEEYGDYFAWGETQPKDTYNWSTYQYCYGSLSTMIKYCNNSNYGYNGFTDNLTTLLPEDDAATANWGADWRMPTKEEWQELYSNTTCVFTTQNGVNGRLFTASNGNSLFLPGAGYHSGSSLNNAGNGFYWSSSLNTTKPSNAWFFFFSSSTCDMWHSSRDYGRSVRAVRSGQK